MFSVPTLDALHRAGRTPVLVVSQPARESGRGRKLRQPPVAQWALDHEVELAQPRRVRTKSFVAALQDVGPDLAVVVAFGQIFPQRLLDVPRIGCVNVHASLLPRHRGASPISAAIDAGDEVTGVCTMVMEAGLDTGPVLLRRETPIGEGETTGELTERLASIGADLLVETVDQLESGGIQPQPQDDEAATHAPMLAKSDGAVDWSQPAAALARRLRAFTPWPGLTAHLAGSPLKLLDVREVQLDADVEQPLAPATLLGVRGDSLLVACGGASVLALDRVQRPGRKATRGSDLWNGERLAEGMMFEVLPPEPQP